MENEDINDYMICDNCKYCAKIDVGDGKFRFVCINGKSPETFNNVEKESTCEHWEENISHKF